jgi:hypothetical protein
LLGCYNNFPTKIHGIARYSYQISTQQLQKTIVYTTYLLNQETHDLKRLTRSSLVNCELNFEFGIAEQDSFTFLDEKETERFFQSMENEPKGSLLILDFFCAIRYHIIDPDGKSKSLRFDYALLRLTFQRRVMELFIVHERGTQRIPLEDLVIFLTNRINNELKKRELRILSLKHMRTL